MSFLNIGKEKEKKDEPKTLKRIKEVNIEVAKNGEIEEKTVIVSKAPLGKWKKLSDSFQKLLNILPEVLASKGLTEQEELEAYFSNVTQQEILMLLPDIMEVAFDEVMKILALGTNKDKKFMEKYVGLDEAVDILDGIIEVNRLLKVVEKGKNLMSLLGRKKSQKKTSGK